MRETEQPALEALLPGRAPGRPFIYTGLVYPRPGRRVTDEDTPVQPEQSPQPYKVLCEEQVLAAQGPAATLVRAALVDSRGAAACCMA